METPRSSLGPLVEGGSGGPRSILAGLVEATKAEIEFSGKRYDLGVGERGLANCRELLKRLEATAKR
jgi:hypothetical protein